MSRIIETPRWSFVASRIAWTAASLPCLIFIPGCTKAPADPRTTANVAPVAIRTVRVEPRPLDVTIDVTGSLVSSVAVDAKTEFAGRVVSLLKQEGDLVSKGELLAQLDDANARLSVAQAKANLEVAQAALERVKVGDNHARLEFERAQNLVKSGGITDKDFQAAQVASRDSQAQVKLAEAQLDQSRQSLAMAEKHQNDCRIISLITGEVERKYVNAGAWVDGNTPLYRLVDNQRLELQTYVASSDIAPVAKGQRIRFNVAAYPSEWFDASILTMSGAMDSQNRSALVRAAVPNPTRKLKAGMFAKGNIITGRKPAVLVVPLEAIWRRTGEAPYLYVIEQNKARKREIRIGQEEANALEITQGLNPGDEVITEQNLEVADGVSVSPRR